MSLLTVFDANGKREFFVDTQEMLWLNGSMLCKRLGFANPSKSIPLHVEECDRQKVDIGTLNPAWFVNEPGTWCLILESKTPEAKEFKHELVNVILPAIRKQGGYISPTASQPQLESLQDQIRLQMDAIEQSFDICKESGDERGIITLKSHLFNLTNKVNGNESDTTISEWLSISEILERRGYNLHIKRVMDSLSQVGKKVKSVYESETDLPVKSTPKHVGSGQHTNDIKVYPPEWFDRIESLAVDYWNIDRTDKKTNQSYNLLKLATAKED